MTTQGRLTVTFRLTAAFRYDEPAHVFVAFVPNLGIYSQGQTKQEAENAIKSAAYLFIKNCLDRGIFEKTLKQRGFDVDRSSVTPVAIEMKDFIAIQDAHFEEITQLDIPVSLTTQGSELCQLSVQ